MKLIRSLFAWTYIGLIGISSLGAGQRTWFLLDRAPVSGDGIYLDQLVRDPSGATVPHLAVSASPQWGGTQTITPKTIEQWVGDRDPSLLPVRWTGSQSVSVLRRARALKEIELIAMLTEAVANEANLEMGALEISFRRPWDAMQVPDGPLQLVIRNLPATGLNANMILRFEILGSDERIGEFQGVVKARLWKEVIVAKAPLKRGDLLYGADVDIERMDALTLRNPLGPEALEDPSLEVISSLRAGQPVLQRSVRIRPLVKRGQIVEALHSVGLLNVSLKVQILKDGHRGETVRVRNVKSKREFYGKVQDENTVRITGI